MYEIRCIVGDKKLREVLVFLNNNNTLEPPVVIPTGDIDTAVVTAAHPATTKPAKKQRKNPIHPGGVHLKGRGSTEVVRNLITQTGVSRITAREMSSACAAKGYSKGAYSHAIKLLLADKTIRKVPGLIGEYLVTNSANPHREIKNG